MSLQTKPIYEFGPFRLDAAEHLLLRNGEAVPLTPKAFDLLLALVERHGCLLEKEELLKKVWPDTFVEEANLASNISQLRKALGDGENGQRFIETAPKRGYRFVASVNKVVDEREEPTIQEQSGSQRVAEVGEQAANAVELITEYPTVKAENLKSKVKRRSRSLLFALALLILSSAGFAYFILRPPLSPKVTASVQVTSNGSSKAFYNPTVHHRLSSALVTDGPRLYFTEGAAPTQVSSAGGETVAIPASFPGSTIGDISPDRSELLVSRVYDEYEGSLWVLPVLGGAPRRLGDLLGHDATWSPDGRQIVYANGSSLYLAKSDGTESRKFVTVEGRTYWPRWSPNGSRLRFTVTSTPQSTASLWEVAADGSNPHPLLPGWNNPASECCGNWTADGRYFVFQSTRDRSTNIWAMREQTGLFRRGSQEPVQLTIGPLNYYLPAPSLDGKKLYVVGEQKRGELSRYDAKTQQLVSYLGGISAEHLDFSRDGEWMAYVSYPEGNLWRSKMDGRQRRQLSFPPMRATLPRWSPDGSYIAAHNVGLQNKLLLFDFTMQKWTELLSGQHTGWQHWSRDGKHIYFYEGGRAIFRVGIGDRKIELWADLKDFRLAQGVFGVWVGWTPDDQPLMMRDVGAQDIYALEWQTP